MFRSEPGGRARNMGAALGRDTPSLESSSSSTAGPPLGYRAQRVRMEAGREAWTVLGPDLVEVAAAAEFLRYLYRIERSPNTLRAYAHDLRLFFEFLAFRSLVWDRVAVADLGDFAGWLRRPADNVLVLPGARAARSASTTNRALSAAGGVL